MKSIDIHIHVLASDPDMDGYVTAMDRNGVEAALVHGLPEVDSMYVCGNEAVARVVRRHRGRLLGSVYVDLGCPAEDNIRLVRQYAALGFKSIKLIPNYGFDPNDEKHEPFWQAVEDLGLMALSHCGWFMGDKLRPELRLQSLTASPFHFEVPARRHPKINFIFSHFGGAATYLETVVLLSRLSNCYADVCPGWGLWVFENRLPGLQTLDRSKVLFGTDNAGNRYDRRMRRWSRIMRSNGYNRSDRRKYFYENAARLLKVG
jgi:predicted TIM-barrel fold metal-dependent hydrolase